MLRYKRETRPWFSRLVRHPARKRSGSILTTPEPARGDFTVEHEDNVRLAVTSIQLVVHLLSIARPQTGLSDTRSSSLAAVYLHKLGYIINQLLPARERLKRVNLEGHRI